MELLQIENQTKKYSDIYSEINTTIGDMNKEVETVKNKYLISLKALVGKLQTAGEKLQEMVKEGKEFFISPKTQILHNFRIGFAKGKGKKEFDNDKTVSLIKKHFPAKAKQLIKTEETVISSALEKLSAADLKKIGVHILDAQDAVVIKPVDTEIKKVIDKIISLVMKNGASDEE